MGKWISDLFNKHMLVRRVLVFWALVMISLIVFKVLDVMTTIDAATASVVSVIVGILATVTGFYIKSRELDHQQKHHVDDDS